MKKFTKIVALALTSSFVVSALASCKPEEPVGAWGQARWIWADGVDSGSSQWIDFRRDFELKTVPEEANVKIACDAKYYLYVNGEQVVYEGGLNRSNGSYTYYDTVNIADYLNEGDNNICVLLWHWGGREDRTVATSSSHYIPSGQGGIILSSQIKDDKGNCIVETGDGHWYAQEDPAYEQEVTRANTYLGETAIKYDARDSVDWISEDFDAQLAGWEKAVIVGKASTNQGYANAAPWNELVERPIPMIKNYGLVTMSLDDARCKIEKKNASDIVYKMTLPYNMQIMPYIELEEGTQAGKEIVMYTETYNLSTLNSTYITELGEQSYESKGWINGDYLYFSIPEGVNVSKVGYRQTGYNVESGEDTPFLGYFDSTLIKSETTLNRFNGGWTWSKEQTSTDNNFYDELWTKSAYTLYVCMRDGYMDCPDRERGQYIGDAVNEIEEAFYSFGASSGALSAKCIREICMGQKPYTYKGKTYYAMSCVEPCRDTHEIQAQELGTALAAWNYYLYTGDASLAVDCFTPLYNYLTNYDYVAEGPYEGTIRMREVRELAASGAFHQTYEGSSLAKWTDWGNNQDISVAINCWWYASAVSVRQLADVAGVNVTEEQKAWLDENIAKVKQNFSKFWNTSRNAYATDRLHAEWYNDVASSNGTHLVDDRVNAMAVVFGLADTSKYPELVNVFKKYKNASIYMEKYVLEALYEMGYPKEAMNRMQERHFSDVNNTSSSTMPEYFGLGDGTKNHGWSGGAISILSKCATGIEPTKAGYSEWVARPQMGNFASFKTCVPAQIGNIEMSVSISASGSEMSVNSPGGTAEIWVPVTSGMQVDVVEGEAQLIGEKEYLNQNYVVFKIVRAGKYQFIAE